MLPVRETDLITTLCLQNFSVLTFARRSHISASASSSSVYNTLANHDSVNVLCEHCWKWMIEKKHSKRFKDFASEHRHSVQKRQSSVSQALGRSGKFLACSTLNCFAIIFVELMKAVKAPHSTGKTRNVVLWRIKSDTSTWGNFYEMQVHKPAAHKTTSERRPSLLDALSFPKSEDSDWARVELATHCFVVVWNADCWTTNPAFLFVLCSDLGKKRNSSETFFPCIFIARLRCRIATGPISYCILLHPLFSAARHETLSLFFSFFFFFFFTFSPFLFFFFLTLTLICTPFNSSHMLVIALVFMEIFFRGAE